MTTADDREWLAADGVGGFASGTAGLVRTRREHTLLAVTSPDDGRRWALVAALDAAVETDVGRIALSSHHYEPDVVHPDGASRVVAFAAEPWPTWRFAIGDGVEIVHEVFMPRGRAAVFLSWRLVATRETMVRLHVRPLLAMRELHALQAENDRFRFEPERHDGVFEWNAYEGVPPVLAYTEGEYQHDPVWYRRFRYDADVASGTAGAITTEDLAAPGSFVWTLRSGTQSRAELMMTVPETLTGYHAPGDLAPIARAVRESERARIAAYRSRLFHSADAFVVSERGGARHSIISTYPPSGGVSPREIFASLRGLCLAPNRLDEAELILSSWASEVVRLASPDGGGPCATVDAPLWFVVAVQEFLTESARRGHWLDDAVPRRLTDACQEVLEYYARGTHSGIGMTEDGLLAAGQPGTALTWMDARIEGTPVTPRVGKPVEVQALWINALTVGARWSERWSDVGEQATQSFAERFWNEERRCLFDVVDVDHVAGALDARVRPNQLLAIGGLPSMTLAGELASRTLGTVERLLWTPMGPRTLSPDDPEYVGRYEGDERTRARAAHRGTVWPWLTGAFIDAVVRVRAAERANGADRVPLVMLRALRTEARQTYLRTLARHLDAAGIGHVSRMADGDDPHSPRGEPFCALALAEVGRVIGE